MTESVYESRQQKARKFKSEREEIGSQKKMKKECQNTT